MTTPKSAGKIWVDPRTDVPDWLATGIGKVVVEYAELEWQFEEIVRMLLKTDIASARIVVTGMNMRGRAKCAVSLAMNFSLNDLAKDIRNLGKAVENVKAERDILAHGSYGSIEGQWCVLFNSGARTLDEFGGISTARSLLPQREDVTEDTISKLRARIKAQHDRAEGIRNALRDALPLSPHISPEQHRQGPLKPHGAI